jgi:hypothetical protein
MTHTEQEYEELRNRYNDAVDSNASLRARLSLAEKVVEAARPLARSCRKVGREGNCTVHSSLTEPLIEDLQDALRALDAPPSANGERRKGCP